jgi:glutathione synthase/RimK-type ligase-like ATP-grasp enzyme
MVIESARQINHALGYAINAVDFAFTDEGLYVLEVTNPVPDFDVNALTPLFFDWVVKRTADYALELLREPRLQFELLDGVGPLRAPL